MLSAILGVYSALFATGYFLNKDSAPALIWGTICIVCVGIIIKMKEKLF